MHLSTNVMNHTCLCLSNRSWSSLTNHRGMEGWVGLGTTTMSKQSAKNHYMTEITVVDCSNHHASLGNWSTGTMSTEPLTSLATSHDYKNWAAKQANVTCFKYDSIKDESFSRMLCPRLVCVVHCSKHIDCVTFKQLSCVRTANRVRKTRQQTSCLNNGNTQSLH